jgi:hypothetical protein
MPANEIESHPPFEIPASILPTVLSAFRVHMGDDGTTFDEKGVKRTFMFVDNTAHDTEPSSYYVLDMPQTSRGNIIAMSLRQSGGGLDEWKVAWGNVDDVRALEGLIALPTTIQVKNVAGFSVGGALIDRGTASGSMNDEKYEPMMLMGPRCLDAGNEQDGRFLKHARKVMAAEWDGLTYDHAVHTDQSEFEIPEFYVLQVNNTLSIACNYSQGGFACAHGKTTVDLTAVPCRKPY